MLIVSIGTGSQNKPYHYEEAKDFGKIRWAAPLIDIMMAGAAETTHHHLMRMFSAVGQPDHYIRLQPKSLGERRPRWMMPT